MRSALASALAWDLLLGVVSAAWALYFIHSFAPGRVNVDIANQYRQAIGKIPVTDWHPPIMSAVWRVLIDVTGEPGSLLVLQVGLIAAACWGLGVVVHRLGAARWVSLLGPAVMVTPWVLSQMTTLWKDTQMAAAMVAAVMLLIIVRFVPKAWILWLPALALLVYAVGLRKNAVFAIVPIAVYMGWCLVVALRARRRRGIGSAAGAVNPADSDDARAASKPSRLRNGLAYASASLVVLIAIGAGVKATDAVIASRVEVTPTGQISQILLDDVMFSVPDTDLMSADAPVELKEKISSARDKCLEMGEIWDAYWNCYGRGATGEPFSPIAYQDELRNLWLSTVITYPLRYLEYRSAVFSYYFFTSRVEYWPDDWHGAADAAGIDRGSGRADYIFQPYVEDFALGTFPMLFKPWFWTLIAGLLLVVAYRSRRKAVGAPPATESPGRSAYLSARAGLAPEITMLAASALCYTFGYFPIVPANHFRYTYWPALAVTVGIVLVLGAWSVRRRRARWHSASPEA
ncbi:hypothetical protein [Brevibacterium casei]|uniref:hypothetical protein n=1 Tax=Brevibacterium casei TaxID=33889 RepID=UPI00223AD080|nr:hypothetical protein [Brevibacterium casei]MCT1550449.1 hypothetical protein [Brevibacterium casei]MCT1559139.1 hypothetical protein [Brevibacterium casei]MCT2206996.1 hypothetical protein [Brevibacterium casei]